MQTVATVIILYLLLLTSHNMIILGVVLVLNF